MVTKILRWGNSLGLRIPKSFAKEAGVEEGSAVDISLDGDRIVICLAKPVRYRISDLVSEIRDENIHEEIHTGQVVGGEAP